MRSLLAALTALAAALAVAACGEKQERTAPGAPQRVNLVLDYLPNPDHAGIYAALRDGDFRRSGLDVKPIVPSDPAAPLKLLATGHADIAISYEPELLLARDRGLPLVAIGALVQEPLTSIMSVGGHGVRSVAGLSGKKVGTAGIEYQTRYLQTILRTAGVDPGSVSEINVHFDLVPAMLTKRVAATLGAFWNVEGVQLQRAHKHPWIRRVDQLGVPTYNELIFVARADALRTRGALFRSFLQALSRSHRDVRRNPAAGVDGLLTADRNLKRGDTEASVKATLPAFFPRARGKPFGYMDPRQWAAYGRWMLRNKLIRQPASPRALTNEFLPGEGL